MQPKKGVIVLGGHVQGLGIIRIYGKNGINCVLLDNTLFNIGRYSKYCTKFIHYQGDLLEKLLELGKEGVYHDWIVLATDDNQVFTLSKKFRFIVPVF